LASISSDQKRAQAQFDLFKAMMLTHMSSVQAMMAATTSTVPQVSVPISSSSSSATSSSAIVPVINTLPTNSSFSAQQVMDMMASFSRSANVPSVVVQAAQSDSKRMDHLGLELVKGVYLPLYFQANFPPIDIDNTTGKVMHYNIVFAVETLRFQKNQTNILDPELSDATLKALILLKFNSGPAGISLHALLGKTTDLTVWTDVLRALRIFRQICDSFIHPDLSLHVAQLLTKVEDLRLQYPLISVAHWVRIFHMMFSKLRGVTTMFEDDPSLDYSKTLKELFYLDISLKIFQEAAFTTTMGSSSRQVQKVSSPTKKRKRNPSHASSPTAGKITQSASFKRSSQQPKVARPHLHGEYPCYSWVANRAPCFDSVICSIVPSPTHSHQRRGKTRPHAFDPADKGVEEEFRAWVMRFANN
jgi:hypothetical protein